MKDPLDLKMLAEREQMQTKYDDSTEFMNKMTEAEIDEWIESVKSEELVQKMIDYNIIYKLLVL